MTDPVDDLLQDAGQRWRSGQPAPPEPDPRRWIRQQPRPRWMPVIAAAAATAVAGGAAFALIERDGPAASPVAAAPSASAPAPDLVVRDGDQVEASGTVLATPGRPVRFCAPAPSFGDIDGAPACTFSVPVTGVDLDTLAEAGRRGAVRFGSARLQGVWRSGVLAVTRQSPPPSTPPPAVEFPPVPCPPPPGGWQPRGTDSNALQQYVEQEHPEQFRRPWVQYPNGISRVGVTPVPANGVQVLSVEVVQGDLEQARRELAKRFAGNLCVAAAPGRPSLADQAKINETVGKAVDRLMADQANGVYTSGTGDNVQVELVMLTPALDATFEKIGKDLLDLRPWLRPVR